MSNFVARTAKTLFPYGLRCSCVLLAHWPFPGALELFGSWLESPRTRLGRRLWTEAKLPPTYVYKTKRRLHTSLLRFRVLIHLCLCRCRTGSFALRGLPHERLTLLTWWVGGPGRAPQTWCGYY